MYGHHSVEALPPPHYPGLQGHRWAAKGEFRQYAADPVGYTAGVTIPPNVTEQLVTAYSNPPLRTTPIVHPHGNSSWKRTPKKTKNKIVQSAWCEVCKVDCNSKEVLEQHKLGKKHKKNLEKSNDVNVPTSISTAGSKNPIIGPQENLAKSKTIDRQNVRKKAPEPEEDLETKRRKIVEGGAAADAVRVCPLCKVACNSDTVFSDHLAGQKHAAMVKKQVAHTGVAATT